MKGQTPLAIAFIGLAAYLLYFFGMSDRGLVGPDEPRYAAIAREMAESGDWVTPRLEGETWFEKPPLLYWLGAAGVLTGLGDRATRGPVALISVVFLAWYYFHLRRSLGCPAAEYATVILGTSAGWVAYSQAGIFDIPLAVTLSAALLVLHPWIERDKSENDKVLPISGAFLGLSVLAKGFVGPVLFAVALLPVVQARGWRRATTALLHPRVTAPFAAIAVPWFLLCFLENGWPFVREFFWRHHIERFLSDSVQHVQPFWFFLPVLFVGLLPWSPLLALYPDSEMRRDPRMRMMIAWALGGFLFFSLSRNKLPHYILPILPPIAALLGVRLSRVGLARLGLAACGFLLCLLPVAEALLPRALSHGLGRAWPPPGDVWWWSLAGVAFGAAVWLLEPRGRLPAVILLATGSTAALIQLKINTFPLIDRHAGTRCLWREIKQLGEDVCLGDVRRHVRYGLNYYHGGALPECSSDPKPFQVKSDPARIAPRVRP